MAIDSDLTLPIYERIKQDLINKIETGLLAVGDRVPSETVLARTLSVSRSQTRQALRDLEMQGYLVRQPGRGSFVAPEENRNRLGGAAASQSAFELTERRPRNANKASVRTVTLAYPWAAQTPGETRHVQGLVRGFADYVLDHGFQPMYYYLAYDPESELRFLADVHNSGTEGLVLWPQFRNDQECDLVDALCQSPFPCVLVDRYLPVAESDFAGTANRAAYEQLTRELLARGHQVIAFLARDFDDSVMEDRFLGFKRALARASLPVHEDLVLQYWVETRIPSFKRLVAHEPRPTGFVCSDWVVAGYLAEDLAAAGIRLDQDAEIVAMDDTMDPCQPVVKPWRCAVQDGYEIGRQAADLLLARIENPAKPVEMRFVPARLLCERPGRDWGVPARQARIPETTA